jgi:MOSC domain-containing protein YiiM
MRVEAIYISDSHNYFGHHGVRAGTAPMIRVARVECLPGQGLAGDRFLDFKPDYKGQITFFSREVYEDLCERFAVYDRDPSVFRRNVLVAGIDLRELIGQGFSIQGIEFEGTGECAPCHWMNEAFHEGAEEALRGRGGLRAKILTHGFLSEDPT